MIETIQGETMPGTEVKLQVDRVSQRMLSVSDNHVKVSSPHRILFTASTNTCYNILSWEPLYAHVLGKAMKLDCPSTSFPDLQSFTY